MRFLTRLRRWLNSTTSKPASWFISWLHQERETESGVSIDGKTALRYAPVWNAVNRICGRLSQLPLVLYEQTGDRTKTRAVKHPAYKLLRNQPNSLMTPATFKELLQYHALLWGNGRAVIVRDRRGDPLELVPLLPQDTQTVLVNGAKWHVSEIALDDTGRTETFQFRDEDVLHIPGLGYDGLAGYPLWELAKNSWGLGLAQEKASARLQANHGVPGLLLEAPPGVFADDEEAKKFLYAFREAHEGLDNRGKTGLLREGIKASQIAQTSQELQTIEQRAFQREEAGLWFLLESMLGIESSVSYNSLEQKQLAELINCLNPWLVKWQEECWRKLLREREKAADSHLFRWSTGALLRSDTYTTYQTLTMGVRGRLITPNEAREILDMDPLPDGDTLQNPAIDPMRRPAKPADDTQPTGDQANSGREPASVNPHQADDRTANRLQAVITARLQDLAAVETARLSDAMDRPAKFRNWASEFYERWKHTLAAALCPMIEPTDVLAATLADTIAVAWCDESQRLLGLPNAESLTWSVTDRTVLDRWPERAAQLAASLLTANY